MRRPRPGDMVTPAKDLSGVHIWSDQTYLKVDKLSLEETGIILELNRDRISVLTPRGIVGWTWLDNVEVVQ